MDMEALAAWGDKRAQAAAFIREQHPGIHPLTAVVMGGDLVSAEEASARVAAGEDPAKALVGVGSYSRFLWAWENLPLDDFFPQIAALWRGADPDDSDPRMLQIWQEASSWFEHQLLTDEGKELPRPNSSNYLTIFRGEEDPSAAVPSGIAFTLDQLIARSFAMGAGSRSSQHGVVLQCSVEPGDVIAYITGRGEQELIIDPRDVIVRKIL